MVEGGAPVFGEAANYGILSVCSMLAWGLGYFGMPQVLLRFMAIRKEEELKYSRRIAMVWVVISLAVAVFIGIVGRALYPTAHLTVTRITLLAIALIAIVIALDEQSVIFKIVSFAWAGFGATFGPIMLFSLFWKRTNRAGAIAGMVGGAAMVFLWKLVISKLGGAFAIYELLPAFIFSAICIVVVSLLTAPPSKEIEEDFDSVSAK